MFLQIFPQWHLISTGAVPVRVRWVSRVVSVKSVLSSLSFSPPLGRLVGVFSVWFSVALVLGVPSQELQLGLPTPLVPGPVFPRAICLSRSHHSVHGRHLVFPRCHLVPGFLELCHTYFILAIGVSLAIISQVPVIMGCFGPLNLEHPLTGGPTKLIRLCVAIGWHKISLTGSSVHLT